MPRRVTALQREIRAIHASFSQLARSFGRIAPLLGEHADVLITDRPGRRRVRQARPRRRPRLSAARRAALKVQGLYLGTLRGLRPRQRAQVKKIRATRGIDAALAAARRMV